MDNTTFELIFYSSITTIAPPSTTSGPSTTAHTTTAGPITTLLPTTKKPKTTASIKETTTAKVLPVITSTATTLNESEFTSGGTVSFVTAFPTSIVVLLVRWLA